MCIKNERLDGVRGLRGEDGERANENDRSTTTTHAVMNSLMSESMT